MTWLTPLGLVFEMLGLALAATEYLGPERFERIERTVRERLRLNKTPSEYERELREPETPPRQSKDALLDRGAYAVSAVGGLLLILLCFAPFVIIFSPQRTSAVVNGLIALYYSVLPTPVWAWLGVGGLVTSLALYKLAAKYVWAKRVRSIAAACFLVACGPILLPLMVAVRIYILGAAHFYQFVYRLISHASEAWDETKARQGRPLLLVGILCVGVGLAMEFLDSL